ncbi:MAG: hypothetical protein ABJN84_11895 [Flavobacteriaceae bacterium]
MNRISYFPFSGVWKSTKAGYDPKTTLDIEILRGREEQYFLGVLPRWSAYVRYAKNIKFKNVELITKLTDLLK